MKNNPFFIFVAIVVGLATITVFSQSPPIPYSGADKISTNAVTATVQTLNCTTGAFTYVSSGGISVPNRFNTLLMQLIDSVGATNLDWNARTLSGAWSNANGSVTANTINSTTNNSTVANIGSLYATVLATISNLTAQTWINVGGFGVSNMAPGVLPMDGVNFSQIDQIITNGSPSATVGTINAQTSTVAVLKFSGDNSTMTTAASGGIGDWHSASNNVAQAGTTNTFVFERISKSLMIGTNAPPSAPLHVRDDGATGPSYVAARLDNRLIGSAGDSVHLLFYGGGIEIARVAGVLEQTGAPYDTALVFYSATATGTAVERGRINKTEFHPNVNIRIDTNNWVYFGPTNAIGSWREGVSGANFIKQVSTNVNIWVNGVFSNSQWWVP